MTNDYQFDRIDLPPLTEREKLRRISEPDSMERMLDDVTKANSKRLRRAHPKRKLQLYGAIAGCLVSILLAAFFIWGELSGYWARHSNNTAAANIINNTTDPLDRVLAILGLLQVAIILVVVATFLVLALFFFVEWLRAKLSWRVRKRVIHRIARSLLLVIGIAWIVYILFTIL